jgi:DNA-binding response OmpR family regulator
MRVLIAEDDRALGLFLSRGLEAEGHHVRLVHDGAQAVDAFREELPDLTILDLNLPVKHGEQALVELRQLSSELPVMVLTGQSDIETRVRCLDSGADDFVLKPFSLSELRARCRALLRRNSGARIVLRAGDLEVDRMSHSVRRGAKVVNLTNREFALLEHLMLNRGHCVSRTALLEAVWNHEPDRTTNQTANQTHNPATNLVDVYVNYLRRKVEDLPRGVLIRTVRGAGYMIPIELVYGGGRASSRPDRDSTALTVAV